MVQDVELEAAESEFCLIRSAPLQKLTNPMREEEEEAVASEAFLPAARCLLIWW